MKPHVICHMMGPLDGELQVESWSSSTGRSADRLIAEYDRIHEALDADAWIAGRAVGEEFADGRPHASERPWNVERPLHVARPGAKEYAIFIDRHGKLHWTGAETYGAPILMVLGAAVPDEHLAELAADEISYVVTPGDRIDLGWVLDVLSTRFIEKLLLEGGARTNADFLRARLVDEISLLLFPAIGGHAGSRTLFADGADGLAERLSLRTISTEVRPAGAIHLRYAVAYR